MLDVAPEEEPTVISVVPPVEPVPTLIVLVPVVVAPVPIPITPVVLCVPPPIVRFPVVCDPPSVMCPPVVGNNKLTDVLTLGPFTVEGNTSVPVKVGFARGALRSSSVWVAVETGFPASVVLSTFARPTSDFVIPVGVLITGDVSVLFVRVSVASFNSVPFKYSDFPEARSMCSDEVHASVASTQLKVLSVVPFRVIPPPSAVASDGVATDPSSIFLSSTDIVVEFNVVVVPLTVRSPESVKLVPETAPVNVAPDNEALLSICV